MAKRLGKAAGESNTGKRHSSALALQPQVKDPSACVVVVVGFPPTAAASGRRGLVVLVIYTEGKWSLMSSLHVVEQVGGVSYPWNVPC